MLAWCSVVSVPKGVHDVQNLKLGITVVPNRHSLKHDSIAEFTHQVHAVIVHVFLQNAIAESGVTQHVECLHKWYSISREGLGTDR